MFKLILVYLIGVMIGAVLWEATIRTMRFFLRRSMKK